jgi:hypothetical protein
MASYCLASCRSAQCPRVTRPGLNLINWDRLTTAVLLPHVLIQTPECLLFEGAFVHIVYRHEWYILQQPVALHALHEVSPSCQVDSRHDRQ